MLIRRLLTASCMAGVIALTVPAFVAPVAAQAKKTTKKAGGSAAKDTAKAGKETAAAALPSDAPKDATGQCKDGTYTTAKTPKGACSGHGGVKTFATAQCSDGTYSFAKSTRGACSGHGGVKSPL